MTHCVHLSWRQIESVYARRTKSKIQMRFVQELTFLLRRPSRTTMTASLKTHLRGPRGPQPIARGPRGPQPIARGPRAVRQPACAAHARSVNLLARPTCGPSTCLRGPRAVHQPACAAHARSINLLARPMRGPNLGARPMRGPLREPRAVHNGGNVSARPTRGPQLWQNLVASPTCGTTGNLHCPRPWDCVLFARVVLRGPHVARTTTCVAQIHPAQVRNLVRGPRAATFNPSVAQVSAGPDLICAACAQPKMVTSARDCSSSDLKHTRQAQEKCVRTHTQAVRNTKLAQHEYKV